MLKTCLPNANCSLWHRLFTDSSWWQRLLTDCSWKQKLFADFSSWLWLFFTTLIVLDGTIFFFFFYNLKCSLWHRLFTSCSSRWWLLLKSRLFFTKPKCSLYLLHDTTTVYWLFLLIETVLDDTDCSSQQQVVLLFHLQHKLTTSGEILVHIMLNCCCRHFCDFQAAIISFIRIFQYHKISSDIQPHSAQKQNSTEQKHSVPQLAIHTHTC